MFFASRAPSRAVAGFAQRGFQNFCCAAARSGLDAQRLTLDCMRD